MGSKWDKITELLPNDDDLTRVVHWYHYKDGQTCAKRAKLVKELRRHGWSVSEVAEALGINIRQVFRITRNDTLTKNLSPATTKNLSP